MKDLVEQVAMEARKSELVDQKSGVSARLTISALENLYSHAERRMLINGEKQSYARVGDLYGILPSITGKVELVYEGELEGASGVAQMLIGKAIRAQFEKAFPNPEKTKKSKKPNPYARVLGWFNEGNTLPLLNVETQIGYENLLRQVDGLSEIVKEHFPKAAKQEQYLLMEFVLHGLAEFSQLSKNGLERGIEFKDLMSGMFDMKQGRSNEDEDYGGHYEEK